MLNFRFFLIEKYLNYRDPFTSEALKLLLNIDSLFFFLRTFVRDFQLLFKRLNSSKSPAR